MLTRCLLRRSLYIKPTNRYVGIRLYSSEKNDGKRDYTQKTNAPIQDIIRSLEPYWNSARSKLRKTNSQIKHYSTQFKYHMDKATQSIREANKKLAQQESEGQDNRLNYNMDVETKGKIEGLPSERERNRGRWARKLEFYLDSLQETIFTATRALNDVTGYSGIQKLRKSIELMEGELEKTKRSVKISKEEYNEAIEMRAQSQREVNELLQRKNSWSPQDLERFTQLYKNDADNLKREEAAKQKLSDMEAKEEELSTSLYRAILTRYHEEQIWSDKIRRTSTWGTFFLMGMNIVLFLVFQLLLEPWKRRRLVGSFEDKVKHALSEYADAQNEKLDEISDYISHTMKESISMKKEVVVEKPLGHSKVTNVPHSDPLTLVALRFNSWNNFISSVKFDMRQLYQWTYRFCRKIYHIEYLKPETITPLSVPELYVLSTILLFAGGFLKSLIM